MSNKPNYRKLARRAERHAQRTHLSVVHEPLDPENTHREDDARLPGHLMLVPEARMEPGMPTVTRPDGTPIAPTMKPPGGEMHATGRVIRPGDDDYIDCRGLDPETAAAKVRAIEAQKALDALVDRGIAHG